MFDLWIFAIGTVASIMLALLKLATIVTFGWLGVCIPVIIGILFVLLRHGLDLGDLLSD